MRIAIIGRTETLYESALKLLEAGHEIPLIITAKEAPEYKIGASGFKELAERIGARYLCSTLFNQQVIEEVKRSLPLDLGISMNYPTIINQEAIDLFKLGILNAHGGDLPRYRGNACQAWAIINGESRIGLCIHKMDGLHLDAGDIIVRDYFPVSVHTKIGQCYKWFQERIPDMFLEAVTLLQNNPHYYLQKQSTRPEDALRCYPRNPEDGRIDWKQTNIEILRLINASSEPYPGAFCTYKEDKLIIWDAELYEDKENYLAVPGQIAEIDKKAGHVIVICGKGKLKVNEVSFANQHRIKPAQVIHSIRERLK
ncbi:MAG: formyl transferase [Chitinophagales bacterium]|nr:MAG: formyl transferase [Chitinophagales bacterium]